jgi:GT2 family glycosyltransferase
MPKASIIILSYNGLNETTAPCLQSIFSETTWDDYEVIVVDNNSSDNTAAYLVELQEREPRLRYVLNASNRGFAGGNNDGIRIASGDYIILLNSDTLVTRNWLEGLLEPLSNDPTIGLAGPVSNSVVNEQQIFTSGTTTEDKIAEGLSWTEKSRGGMFDTEMLGFFCVAIRRDVLEKVGTLDEGFGQGFFEDDDYCIRIRNAGYRIVCVEDVFVYHRGGGTFGQAGEISSLVKQNRERLRRKHPIRSRYSRSRPPYQQIRIIESYIDEALRVGLNPDLQYKICNRMRLVESYTSKRLIKRIKIYLLTRRLKNRLKRCGFMSC